MTTRLNAPAALRNGQMILARGSLLKPALRFTHDFKTGIDSLAVGALQVVVNQFRSAEFTEMDAIIRSNIAAATNATPLTLARANATTANGQEIRQDFMEVATPIARLAAYRETATKYGWKFYGFDAGLHATPALTIDSAKGVTTGSSLVVGGGGLTVSVGGITSQGGITINTGNLVATAGSLIGSGTGASSVMGNFGAGTATPQNRLHTYQASADSTGLFVQVDNGFSGGMLIGNTGVIGTNTKQAVIGMGMVAGRYLGGDGDLSIYTSVGAGNVLLGRASTLRISIEAAQTRFMSGATELARLMNGGNLGLFHTAPEFQIHVLCQGAGQGIVVTAPTPASISSPLFGLHNHATSGSATRQATMALALATGHFHGGTVAGDMTLFTGGSAAGRMMLGTNSTPRMILGTAGKISVGASEGSGQFNIMESGTSSGSGLRIYNPNTGFYMDVWSDVSAHGLINVNGVATSMWFDVSTGYVTVGATTNPIARLNVVQSSNGPSQGFSINYLGGTFRAYIEAAGEAVLSSVGTAVRLNHATNLFAPNVHNVTALGSAALAWQSAYIGGFSMDGSNFVPIVDGSRNVGTAALRFGAMYSFAYTAYSGINTPYLYINQTGAGAPTVAQGLTIQYSGGVIQMYQDTSGNFVMVGPGPTAFQIGIPFNVAAWIPMVDNIASLGQSAKRWLNLYATTITTTTVNGTTVNATNFGGSTLTISSTGVVANLGINTGGAPAYLLQVAGLDSAAKPGTNTWTVASDRRVKYADSIHKYTGGLEQILALRPVHYRTNGLAGTIAMSDSDPHLIGLMADEAMKVSPELVSSYRGKLSPDDAEETDILTLNSHALTYMLINAFVEVTDRLERLEHRKGAA